MDLVTSCKVFLLVWINFCFVLSPSCVLFMFVCCGSVRSSLVCSSTQISFAYGSESLVFN